MREFIGKKVLVTTEGWFYGEDGRAYRSIHGTLKGVHEAKDAVGFTPNRTHTNWFFEIGKCFIMGCQIMYVIQCDEVNTEKAIEWNTPKDGDSKSLEYERPSVIYITD